MKYAVITGATGGIGSAIVKKLASEGYFPVMLVNSNIKSAEKLVAECGGCYFKCDFENDVDVEQTAEKILAEISKVDVLVNCAGISFYGLFTDFDANERERIFKVNVISAMNFTRKILPVMISRKSGKIINITSMWGETGASCEVDYSATKAAVIGFTKALAKEVGPSGITVNAVSPGVIKTPMLDRFSEDELDELKEETPLEKIGMPEDVANTVAFLISKNADFITGEVIRVNGGFLI